jgi:hypothetical protein
MHKATGTSQHLVISITKIIDWSSLVGEARMAKRNRVTRAAAGVVCPGCSKNSVVGFPRWRLADHMIFPNVPTTFAAFACLFDLKDFVHIIDDTRQATRKRASSRRRPPPALRYSPRSSHATGWARAREPAIAALEKGRGGSQCAPGIQGFCCPSTRRPEPPRIFLVSNNEHGDPSRLSSRRGGCADLHFAFISLRPGVI